MAAEKKVLIVYYSRADENYSVGNISKGDTEIIAEMIAKKTGGTLLHVEPAKEYPKGYDDCINVAKKELAQDARPAIKPVNVNPEDFDEIYVGYPVWWGEMPMPMFTFFEKRNLPDNVTSYVATYSSRYNTYTFNNISSLVNTLWANKGKSADWNKVVLIPVKIETSNTTSGTAYTNVSNDMELKSTRLVGGSANRHEPVTISVIYNKFR